jgi:transcriptional regulator with XRE-family HTH domain
MLLTEIGAEVKAAREERGLTIAQLSRYTHVGPRIIARLESGECNVRWADLERLCAVLGLIISVGRVAHRRPTLYELQAQDEEETETLRGVRRD